MSEQRRTVGALYRLVTRAELRLRQGRLDEAIDLFDEVAACGVRRGRGAASDVPLDPNPYVARAELGLCYCYLEQGLLHLAAHAAESALAADPDQTDALCELAYLRSLLGSHDSGFRLLQEGLERHPECARIHKALGCFYLQMDDLDNAIASCRRAVEFDPRADVAYMELAVALGRAGQFEEAIERMRDAIGISPRNPDYHFTLAALYRETRRTREAQAALERGLKYDPENREMLEASAEVALERGDADRAVRYAHRAIRQSINSVPARDVLGAAYLQQGRLHEALRVADQLVAMSPLDPTHHFKKAILFQQQGMLAEALQSYERVVRLAPESELGDDARRALELIDNHQLRQILLLASEDTVFRTKLRRDAIAAVSERCFSLSDAGAMALESLDLDGLSAFNHESGPTYYH